MSIDPTYRAQAQEYLSAVRRWVSEIDSWGIELMFLQRMLDIYGLKAHDDAQTAQVRTLKTRMVSFRVEDCEQLKKSLVEHDGHLRQIVEDRLLLQDRELPYKHSDAERSMQEARVTYHQLQASAFGLIEELKLG
jgi:hypothetical protein